MEIKTLLIKNFFILTSRPAPLGTAKILTIGYSMVDRRDFPPAVYCACQRHFAKGPSIPYAKCLCTEQNTPYNDKRG